MHRPVKLGTTLLITMLAVLVTAAPVAASGFSYQVRKNTCTSTGGIHGYGHLYIKVKHAEQGDTGANALTIDSRVLHRSVNSTRWVTEFRWRQQIYTFPSDANNHWQVGWRSYDPAEYAWHRIVLTIAAWHNTTRLAHKKIYGVAC